MRRLSVRARLIALWAVAFVAWIAVIGFSNDRFTVVFWVLTALIAFTWGTRPWWQAPLDWAPIIVFFILYDATRGAADFFGFPTHWQWPAEVDRWLGFGHVPSVWLQQHLAHSSNDVPFWEIVTGVTYMSHFFVPFVLGGYLWLRARPLFTRYMTRLFVISLIGVVGYVIFPAAPPWAAARCTPVQVASGPHDPPCLHDPTPADPDATILPAFTRDADGRRSLVNQYTARGWQQVPGMHLTKGFVQTGIDSSNKVAAIPSLHAAGAMFVAAFFWPRVRRRWRPLLALYPLAMGFSLVYGGDHYVVDVLLGWVVVAVTMFGVDRLDRWRAARRRSPEVAEAA